MAFALRVLDGTRILSLALNLPGPAALMRCQAMGAGCTKIEPPSGDPMAHYNRAAYQQLHAGMKVLTADLKTNDGQTLLHRELAQADVLLTSFRPSAFSKLGISWSTLHSLYPTLSHIAIVGEPGELAEAPGHDLTYLAANALVPGLELPATLYADMSGSLMATEAVLQAAVHQQARTVGNAEPITGVYIEVALSDAARYVALPRTWGLTQHSGPVGGAHAGYRIYPCKDGRVAVAALEPHFAAALCAAADAGTGDIRSMFNPSTHAAIAAFMLTQTRAQLDKLAINQDLPIHTMV